ncbi:hypothetical protein AB0M50_50640 [Nonomuraea fuscirosea]|jgi:peptide deformylase|nr:hypothetical protein [Nonomuraea fuscirosea]WSA56130.1 hypothetical protein OIE67_16450 [Nonomuraea fuscirosea]
MFASVYAARGVGASVPRSDRATVRGFDAAGQAVTVEATQA